MTHYIKYQSLSDEIKKEFKHYLEVNNYSINDIDVDVEILKWFDEYFEKWFKEKYNKDDKKRKFNRLDIEIPVVVVETLIDYVSNELNEGEEIIGDLINISRGGMYFRSIKPIDKSSIIKVRIELSKIESNVEDIEALAMVKRIDKNDDDSYGIGLMFSTIYEEGQNELDIFIFKKLAELFS